ncbi:hydroxymethylglutaryl-CoA lyase [Polychaeton citri CBS 116435]|uniref:hydroxymethylglutaryl-CoA lyase n=1 Tax=Polychaeton citri CBS 116435 TaxID=1314669 RepID=A0A9P4Q0H0_9PEZI|nr:hydroxymethylglutaryl-CoA lyase [Polychaeton citri CBS 116435]
MTTRQVPRLLSKRAISLRRQQQSRLFSSSRRVLADHVRIVEVGPRDGLQNEKSSISPEIKTELVRRLARTGLQTIEAGSFVAPKWVPQMAASDQIMKSILGSPPPSSGAITYQWLLPNMKGLDNFYKVLDAASGSRNGGGVAAAGYPTPPSSPLPQNDTGPALNTSSSDPNAMPSSPGGSGVEAMSHNEAAVASATSEPQIHEISIFMAATESFSKKNTNCSIAESLSRFEPLMKSARDRNINVRAYISVALGCPFEGPDTDPHRVAEIAASLLELGADEISVADTTGMGTAPRTRRLLQTLKEAGIRSEDIALHFHDTFGQALINTMVGLEHGVRTFDSAVGGLGGCPYSPGATGNLATEDLVYFLHSLGADTGVDLEETARVGEWITDKIGKGNDSSVGKATMARLTKKGAHA